MSSPSGESSLPIPSNTSAQHRRISTSLKRLDRLAHLMDDQFKVPLINQRIGLDPIIGLIPGGGDWVSWAISVYIFWEAARLGVPTSDMFKMAANIAIDLLGGYVPAIGDMFDFAFKANRRNVQLIHAHFGGAPQLDASLPDTLPVRSIDALEPRSRLASMTLWFVLSSLLFVLASGPIILAVWYWQS